MKQNKLHMIPPIAGAVLIAAGICLLLALPDSRGALAALAYVCLGLGCGLLGQGVGNVIAARQRKRNPGAAHLVRIEKNDERNAAVLRRAKARTLDVALILFAALILSFTLLGVGAAAILLSVLVYLAIIGCLLFFQIRYNGTM